jgi:dTDP-4-amino-4,6-dideoxygalactose transaminase
MNVPIAKPFIDDVDIEKVVECIKSGWIVQGKNVENFEDEFAKLCNTKYAVAVNSCTSGLFLSLMACGVEHGDEVIVTPFSFIASANCVLHVGATPIFVDIDIKTYNIDPDKIKKKITDRTKAIIAVHQFGLMADMAPILKVAEKYNLYVIEDAACAHNAEYKGAKAGSMGITGCFSFHPRKLITTGEGGMVTTNDEKIYEFIQAMRNHGMSSWQSIYRRHEEGKINLPQFEYAGYNLRMTDFQGAMGRTQLKKLKSNLAKRRAIAKYYDKNLDEKYCSVPTEPKDFKHVYQSYVVMLKKDGIREEVIERLSKKGVTTQEGTISIHLQPVYQRMFGSLSLPNSELVSKNSLSLPMFVEMSEEEQKYVVETVNEALANIH